MALQRGNVASLVAAAALLLLSLSLLIAAMLNPRVKAGDYGVVEACIIPIQNITVSPLAAGSLLKSFTILYYNCSGGLCSANIFEKHIPMSGGTTNLGPSLLQTVLASSSYGLLPPTRIAALRPGVLEFDWLYPDLNVSVILTVEGEQAYLVLGKGIAEDAKIVEIEGCSVSSVKTVVGHNGSYFIYKLLCGYNIAATKNVKVEVVLDRLNGLLLDVEPSKPPDCEARAVKLLYLKLPFMAASTALLAVAATLLYKRLT